jgi:hypothetical protein
MLFAAIVRDQLLSANVSGETRTGIAKGASSRPAISKRLD